MEFVENASKTRLDADRNYFAMLSEIGERLRTTVVLVNRPVGMLRAHDLGRDELLLMIQRVPEKGGTFIRGQEGIENHVWDWLVIPHLL